MTAHPVQQDHQCDATHCQVCCPRAQGWNDGYESARVIYHTETRMRLLDPPPIHVVGMLVCLTIITLAVLQTQRRITALESGTQDAG